MPKHKKFKAKELKHDPFRDWYEKQAEWTRRHRTPIRKTLYAAAVAIIVIFAGILGYSYWDRTAERRLAEAFDIFNAEVTETPAPTTRGRTYRTDQEKYRAALEAYKRVAEKWYYRFSDDGKTAKYYEAVCQLHLNSPEGQASLERLAEGSSMTARLARLALAEHAITEGDAARAETLYRQLVGDAGPLPKPQLQLGLARALEAQGKKPEAVALYVEIAKERSKEMEGSEAIARLANLDPAALDQVPSPPPSAQRNALSRYKKQ